MYPCQIVHQEVLRFHFLVLLVAAGQTGRLLQVLIEDVFAIKIAAHSLYDIWIEN